MLKQVSGVCWQRKMRHMCTNTARLQGFSCTNSCIQHAHTIQKLISIMYGRKNVNCEPNSGHVTTQKRRLSIQQHCGHWWHRKWSLQLTVSPVTTKLSHWPSFVFSAPAYAMNNIYFFSVVVTHWLNFKRTFKKCKHNLYEISKLQHFETCQQSTPTIIIKTVWLIQNGVSWCFLVGISSY